MQFPSNSSTKVYAGFNSQKAMPEILNSAQHVRVFRELLKCFFQWPAAKDAVAKGGLTAKTAISSVKRMRKGILRVAHDFIQENPTNRSG